MVPISEIRQYLAFPEAFLTMCPRFEISGGLVELQNFLDRCFKRKYISKRMDIRNLLEKADGKLFKVRSIDPDCPLSENYSEEERDKI